MTTPGYKQTLTAIEPHLKRLSKQRIENLYSETPDRFEHFSEQLENFVFDYSKNLIDEDALAALAEAAIVSGVEKRRDAMFAGEKLNETENRSVLHVALRGSTDPKLEIDGVKVSEAVEGVLQRMREFTNSLRSGGFKPSGKPITDVVNIGIGGSDLGPAMVAEALELFADGPHVHFVSNVDYADIASALENLDPASTLFIVASKTFTTAETMLNANAALAWVGDALGDEVAGSHFIALSANLEATRKFGIADENCFEFWDWVGGRYSVWSAIGLSVMLRIGPEKFDEFLSGARAADDHFKGAKVRNNIPILMALIGIWNAEMYNARCLACLPYDDRLSKFPAWLQQLEMESNGKSVTLDGEVVGYHTAPVIFGQSGTNGQHAFYQAMHQGTQIIPSDFLIAIAAQDDGKNHRSALLVNCFAQSEALMYGQTLDQAGGNPHMVFPGNRPSNTFLYRELDPKTLGMLMAFYEHKVFVQGVIWDINSFDQFGVELGKKIASSLEKAIQGDGDPKGRVATIALLDAIKKLSN